MAKHEIEITDTPPGAVDTTIKKGNQDRVKWWSKSKDWVVVFKKGETPFERSYYNPAENESKEIKVEPGDKKYEYMVCVDGKIFNSPWIRVDG